MSKEDAEREGQEEGDIGIEEDDEGNYEKCHSEERDAVAERIANDMENNKTGNENVAEKKQ
jgi:hypothetical protein